MVNFPEIWAKSKIKFRRFWTPYWSVIIPKTFLFLPMDEKVLAMFLFLRTDRQTDSQSQILTIIDLLAERSGDQKSKRMRQGGGKRVQRQQQPVVS